MHNSQLNKQWQENISVQKLLNEIIAKLAFPDEVDTFKEAIEKLNFNYSQEK